MFRQRKSFAHLPRRLCHGTLMFEQRTQNFREHAVSSLDHDVDDPGEHDAIRLATGSDNATTWSELVGFPTLHITHVDAYLSPVHVPVLAQSRLDGVHRTLYGTTRWLSVVSFPIRFIHSSQFVYWQR